MLAYRSSLIVIILEENETPHYPNVDAPTTGNYGSADAYLPQQPRHPSFSAPSYSAGGSSSGEHDLINRPPPSNLLQHDAGGSSEGTLESPIDLDCLPSNAPGGAASTTRVSAICYLPFGSKETGGGGGGVGDSNSPTPFQHHHHHQNHLNGEDNVSVVAAAFQNWYSQPQSYPNYLPPAPHPSASSTAATCEFMSVPPLPHHHQQALHPSDMHDDRGVNHEPSSSSFLGYLHTSTCFNGVP